MSHEDCHIINRKVIIGNYKIKNLSMSEMNHDGVEGHDLLAESHIVQENTDTDSDGDTERATELEISGKVGDDGDTKGKSNILEETMDVQSPILAVSQQPQYHDFVKENNPMNETLVIRSPPVPTRLILGPLRAAVIRGSSGHNPIEAEVIRNKNQKESEEQEHHDKLVKEEMK